jgi:NADH-quinone oxidoreductase subunit H
MAIKMGVFILLQMWVRGTLPRVRYDHLMSLGWKLLLPAATINLLITSVVVAYRA